MPSHKIEVAIKNCCPSIGEGPHWDVASQSLLYVDINTGGIHRWNSSTGEESKINLDGTVGFVIPRSKGGLVVGLNKTVSVVDFDTKSVEQLVEVDQGEATRFNDAKCDAAGRLWAGTMGEESKPAVVPKGRGSLYCIDTDLSKTKQAGNIDISNGMDWTDDNTVMYYIDSIPRKVFAYDFDFAAGKISNQRTVVDFEGKPSLAGAFPDGMCIDCEGKIWVACFAGSSVHRFDPETGATLLTLEFPATNITSVCFGGPNLDELFVTCSSWRLNNQSDQPLAGSVFKVTGLGVKGRAPNEFKG